MGEKNLWGRSKNTLFFFFDNLVGSWDEPEKKKIKNEIKRETNNNYNNNNNNNNTNTNNNVSKNFLWRVVENPSSLSLLLLIKWYEYNTHFSATYTHICIQINIYGHTRYQHLLSRFFSPTHSSILLGARPSEWRNVDTKTNGTTRHVKRKNEKKKSPERGNEPKAATIKRIQTQSRPLGYRKTRKKSLKITNAKPTTTTRKWHKQINGDL